MPSRPLRYLQSSPLNRQRCYKALFLCSLVLCLWFGTASKLTAQAPDAAQQVQTGVNLYQAGQIPEAIAQWQQALDAYKKLENLNNQAIVLENLARATQQIGQTNDSLSYWTQAVKAYEQLGNLQQIGRSLTEQAQAHSRLGQYSEAIAILCGEPICQAGSAVQIVQSLNDKKGEVAALGSLGDAYRLQGDSKNAIKTLEQALEIARSLDNTPYLIATLNSLGNTYISQAENRYQRANSATAAGDTQEATAFNEKGLEFDRQALKHLRESMAIAQNSTSSGSELGKTRALISEVPILYRLQDPTAPAQLQQAIALAKALPHSSDKVYAILDLTHLLQPEQSNPAASKIACPTTESALALELLELASASAQTIGDTRSQSFAWGELGRFYECRGNAEQALAFTQKARLAAEQNLRAKDSLYLWEWQTGRILKQQGNQPEAIAAYDAAVKTLEEIRNDLLSANRDLQFDFRDAVNPLYRQLITLRLEAESLPLQTKSQNSNLSSALQTLDSLRLAELQNYFGNDCVIRSVQSDNDRAADASGVATLISDPTAAIFSSIILEDKTAIVVTFPDGTQKLSPIDVDSVTLSQTVNQYRKDLESFFIDFNPISAQTIYRWIIEPFAQELKQQQIETLVFIQDGILRSVPMSALRNPDTKDYLIQDYAIAITPSLNLGGF
jgi:tetratricopeptide (TPR) repeat protein